MKNVTLAAIIAVVIGGIIFLHSWVEDNIQPHVKPVVDSTFRDAGISADGQSAILIGIAIFIGLWMVFSDES